MRGISIVCEGADGAGKSTLVRRLFDNSKYRDRCVTYSHPGSTPLGQEIRKLVKHRKDIQIDKYTEQVLMAADLCNFISSILKPSVEAGKIVLNDRSNFVSGMIYGLAGGLSFKQIESFQQVALALEPPPMHLILLTGDYDTIAKRQHHDTIIEDGKQVTVECKFQSRGNEFHKRVTELYNKLAEAGVGESILDADVSLFRSRLNKFVACANNKLSVWPIDVSHSAEQVLKKASFVVEQIVATCSS
jgi:dTMP kinase